MKTLISIIILNLVAVGQVIGATELEAEVNHLLHYLTQADCQFIRNGDKHPAAEAVKHIQKKYDHFKDEIETAEDFIRLSASQSLISRRPYKVSCSDGVEVNSKDWLMEELAHYRKQSSND